MSVEHQPKHSTPEHKQALADLKVEAERKLEELRPTAETTGERPDRRAEAAREIINKPKEAAEEPPAAEAETQSASRFAPLLDPRLNYKQTLASVQKQLRPVSRSFSKIIHAPAVEKASEVLEKTVARPSVTLGATWTALIVGSLFYFMARHFGYALSGSELMFSFIVGAAIGLGLEGVLLAIKRI